MARRRPQWAARQRLVDPARLVFSDETWTKTNMAPLRGWAPRGQRLKAKVPIAAMAAGALVLVLATRELSPSAFPGCNFTPR